MRALAVVALLVLAAAPVVAQPAPPPETRGHIDAGLAKYDRGDYNAAIIELEAAYRLDPQPRFLFAIAQAKRLAGHCDEALPMYEHYLATEPGDLQVEATETGIALCKEALAARERDRPLVSVTELDPGSPRDDLGPAPRPGRNWRIAAVASGITTVAAATLWAYLTVKINDTEDALVGVTDLDELNRLNAQGERYSRITFVTGPIVVVGATIFAVALYKGFISPPSRESKRVVVTPTLSPTTAGAALTLSF